MRSCFMSKTSRCGPFNSRVPSSSLSFRAFIFFFFRLGAMCTSSSGGLSPFSWGISAESCRIFRIPTSKAFFLKGGDCFGQDRRLPVRRGKRCLMIFMREREPTWGIDYRRIRLGYRYRKGRGWGYEFQEFVKESRVYLMIFLSCRKQMGQTTTTPQWTCFSYRKLYCTWKEMTVSDSCYTSGATWSHMEFIFRGNYRRSCIADDSNFIFRMFFVLSRSILVQTLNHQRVIVSHSLYVIVM